MRTDKNVTVPSRISNASLATRIHALALSGDTHVTPTAHFPTVGWKAVITAGLPSYVIPVREGKDNVVPSGYHSRSCIRVDDIEGLHWDDVRVCAAR